MLWNAQKYVVYIIVAAAIYVLLVGAAHAQQESVVDLSTTDSEVLRTAFLITVLTFIPAAFITLTSFTRIVIVLAMVRHAFGMPETPPNPVLITLALFLTVFVMSPTFSVINESSISPLLSGAITIEEALKSGEAPLREFMLRQVSDKDIQTIYEISRTPLPGSADEVEFFKLVPAFILNELRVSFTIGFVILLPFLMIELVVAAVLLSLGMMMVPPATISLPIKILMFVLIDGWSLIIQGVLGGFA